MRHLTSAPYATLVVAAVLILNVRHCAAALWTVPPLGQTILDSDAIVILRVEQVDKAKSVITYRKLKDLKGKFPTDLVSHPIDPQHQELLRWAAASKKAVLFFKKTGAHGALCIDHHWYGIMQVKGAWRSYPASQLLFSFCDAVEELTAAVLKILGGNEIVVRCVLPQVPSATVSIIELDELRKRGPHQIGKVRASLKLKDFDPKRDLVPAEETVNIDLAKIPRALAKEPAYQSQPKYCLLVFGPEAETRVWLVLDGDLLYVDRNSNGDLTEKGERLAAAKFPDGLKWQIGGIVEADGKTRHAELRLWFRRGSCTFHLRTADGIHQEVGNEFGPLRFADRAKDAPIVHLAGPLTFFLRTPRNRILEEGGFIAVIGTAGLGEGTTAYCHTEEFGKLKMVGEVEFPRQAPAASLKVRCKYDGY